MPTQETAILTVEQYLRGKVRNITVPDNALKSICCDAEVEPSLTIAEATAKEKDLALAWLYVWVAGSPAQSGGFTEKDGDWQKSENGERMSANVLARYLRMANEIFAKYDLPAVGNNSWGMNGYGFHNIRRRR